MERAREQPVSESRLSKFDCAAGVALIAGAALLWLAPGRLDSIDGQLRYEVSKNLLWHGSPDLRDPALPGMIAGAVRRSSYALGPSLAGLPLVWLGFLLGGELEAQFLFSLTTPLFGAVLAGLLVLSYRRLGLTPKQSAAWALLSVLATSVLPTTLSIFDQVQEAVWLLAATLTLMRAKRTSDFAFAGLCAGLIVFWQTGYIVLIPGFALALVPFKALRDRDEWRRTLPFWVGLAIGPLLAALYNYYRFDDVAQIASSGGPPRLANPLVGLAVLLISPGKSILLYCPAVLLGLIGIAEFSRRSPLAARFAYVAMITQLLFVSSLLFCAGDWAWGPRYLTVTLPLLMLAAPFGAARLAKSAVITLLVLSASVQLLGIAIDHHRFFFDRNLEPQFWTDRSFYFHESALFARPGEIAESFSKSFTQPKALFPSPYPELPTYTTFGPPQRLLHVSHLWQEQYPGLYWPRPWPLWSRLFGTYDRVLLMRYTEALLLLLLLAGAGLCLSSLRKLAGAHAGSR